MRANVSAKLAPIAPQPTMQTFKSHPLKFRPALCSWKKGDAAEASITSPLTFGEPNLTKPSSGKNLSRKVKACKGLLKVSRKSELAPEVANGEFPKPATCVGFIWLLYAPLPALYTLNSDFGLRLATFTRKPFQSGKERQEG
jgi:hypothetical protein